MSFFVQISTRDTSTFSTHNLIDACDTQVKRSARMADAVRQVCDYCDRMPWTRMYAFMPCMYIFMHELYVCMYVWPIYA